MMIPMGELLAKAKKEGYGVAAPNVFNRETIEACFLAAKKLRAPIILDVAAVHGIYECADIARYYEKQYPEVPFALNLDHGGAYEDIVKAIHAGFSSVMIDRSTCAYEKNVEEVKEIVKIAHAVGTSVEAELGHIFTSEVVHGEGGSADSKDDYDDLDDIYTDPEVAKKFVELTGVDCLAIAFGTTHGVYLTEPKLDLPRVAKIREAANVPLVMHGGSGVSDEDYAVAIENGICKVNYYTYMNVAGGKASKEFWKDDETNFYDSMAIKATEAIKEDVKRAIKVFQKIK